MTARFVVICHERTGSMLLGSLLAAHPQIDWGDEYFKALRRRARRDFRHLLAYWAAYWLPVPYLNRQARRADAPVYGCKLMPHYAAAVERTVPALHRQGWRVVWLQRRDVFTGALSHIVAAAGKHWVTRPGQASPAAPTLRIEPAELLAEIQARLLLDEREQRAVAGLPHLKLVYEGDLADAACWPVTMVRVFDYLGLPAISLQHTVSRTWDRPYQEIVVNYADLVAAVRDSDLASVLSFSDDTRSMVRSTDEERS